MLIGQHISVVAGLQDDDERVIQVPIGKPGYVVVILYLNMSFLTSVSSVCTYEICKCYWHIIISLFKTKYIFVFTYNKIKLAQC